MKRRTGADGDGGSEGEVTSISRLSSPGAHSVCWMKNLKREEEAPCSRTSSCAAV